MKTSRRLQTALSILLLMVVLLGSTPVLPVSARQADVPGGLLQFAPGAHMPNPAAGKVYLTGAERALTWSTFLGGTGEDGGYEIAVDGSGNIYVTGRSDAAWGTPINAHAGGRDAFVAKFDHSGAMQWHTFLGGTGDDRGYDIVVDGSGNIYVVGQSGASWGAPLIPFAGGDNDAYVAKLDSSGILQWHTFLGGTSWDNSTGIALDGSGNIYTTGSSGVLWGTPLNQDGGWAGAFIAKLDGSGALQWHTFVGGAGNDYGKGIDLDGSENIYVVGESDKNWGTPLRAYSKGVDAFVAKLNTGGALQWHTFLGGKDADAGNGIIMDESGNVYVTGTSVVTWGKPRIAFAGGNDAYVTKLTGSGALLWHTFLGGADWDYGHDIVLDGNGDVYVAGFSGATWGAPLHAFAKGVDTFVARLNSRGTLQWNTFLGGNGSDYGRGIALDGDGNISVTGISDATWGAPLNPFAGGSSDAFVALVPPSITFSSIGLYDGWVLESRETSNKGGSLNRTAKTFQVGDDALDRQYKSILSFDTSGLPDDAIISSAVLRIKPFGSITGSNPFVTLGRLLVDVCNGTFGTIALEVGDFQAPATARQVGVFGRTPRYGWYNVTLTATGIGNINKIGVTQLRLYFAKDDNNNLAADFMQFFSGNSAIGKPELIITYTAP